MLPAQPVDATLAHDKYFVQNGRMLNKAMGHAVKRAWNMGRLRFRRSLRWPKFGRLSSIPVSASRFVRRSNAGFSGRAPRGRGL